MELADRIVVLDGGRIAQVGAPQDIYENPANSYVAGFVGSSNSVEGTVRSVTAASVTVDTPFGEVAARPSEGLVAGQPVDVMFRPQYMKLHAEPPVGGGNVWPMRLRKIMHAGTHAEAVLTHEHTLYQARVDTAFDLPLESDVWVEVAPRHVFAFAKRDAK